MDLAAAAAAVGGGGPAPFLLKTYDMVDDSSTDNIVAWSDANNSFVVWDPPEFARTLLPTYFKHNNFSSFIRQLNTYGFRKIDPEKWEFFNEDFVKGQKHLLKNIHRRKPIHSHSNPQGSAIDPERAAFEEEIEGLTREKAEYEAKILKFEEQRLTAKYQLDTLTQRVGGLEQRQQHLLTFLEKAIQNPAFVDQLSEKIDSMDFAAYSKKRRVFQSESRLSIADKGVTDTRSSSRPDIGQMFHQDFSNKLNLELSPCVTDTHLVSRSTQSSNEDGGSSQRVLSEGTQKLRKEFAVFSPEAVELSDTGMSLSFNMNLALPCEAVATSGNPCPKTTEDSDSLSACHLNLSLASSPLQANRNQLVGKTPQIDDEPALTSGSRSNANEKEIPVHTTHAILSSTQGVQSENVDRPAAPQPRVNDAFWEQYLTERPGCSDNEETSSKLSIKLI